VNLRAEYLAKTYKIRYRKLLVFPNWTEDGLREISPRMKKTVRAKMQLRDITKARILFAESVALTNVSPTDIWENSGIAKNQRVIFEKISKENKDIEIKRVEKVDIKRIEEIKRVERAETKRAEEAEIKRIEEAKIKKSIEYRDKERKKLLAIGIGFDGEQPYILRKVAVEKTETKRAERFISVLLKAKEIWPLCGHLKHSWQSACSKCLMLERDKKSRKSHAAKAGLGFNLPEVV